MIGKNGTLNNLKMYNEFLLIDTSLSEDKIIDFVKKNPKCGVISFDFTINEILNQHKIEFESSENFLKNFNYQKIQDIIYKLSYWSENSSIKEFLVFKNINIGKLFFDEILDYLVKFCKYFFALKSISQNYLFVPIFHAKLPPRTEISIAPLFLVPHGFPASHFEAQYQSNKMAKTDFLLKVKNGRQITPNLTNEKLC